ncbi:hypothetical protein IW261DRAFT_1425961 [Armillaria novae-zelandiae]|uniref:Uncharacterized protein n=1 Tax=Armillaria novae-zelandiae TaxID=153914 RepID=A0AA39U7U0_9AGAR|nr:hypothetical protein IW261DRAFT_1425961 [Armillaria novae-zelandiae]
MTVSDGIWTRCMLDQYHLGWITFKPIIQSTDKVSSSDEKSGGVFGWNKLAILNEQRANLPDARGERAPVIRAASPPAIRERPKYDVKELFPRRYPDSDVGPMEAVNNGSSFSRQGRVFPPLTAVPNRNSTVWDNVANTAVRTPYRQVRPNYGSPSISSLQEPFDRLGTASSKIAPAISHASYRAFPTFTVGTAQQSSGVIWPRVPGRRGMLGAQQVHERAWNTFVASRKESSDWGYTERYWQ